MYVYDCNAILTTDMNNISDKEIIQAFIYLTEDFKKETEATQVSIS